MSNLSKTKPPVSLRKRDKDSHKGLFGHVLVIGGNSGMAGAPCLTAIAALRAGAGRVTLMTLPPHAVTAHLLSPELMAMGVAEENDIPFISQSATVIALGPGLGSDKWADKMMHFALNQTVPLVVDADALNALAHHPSQRDNWVLTPHPGEAARLLGISAAEIQADRQNAVLQLQQRYGGVVVLKGAGTLIASPQGSCELIEVGNPGMASPGMGDCLTGVIAALLAQHLSLLEAARLGVWVHGRAGDLAAQADGERGLLASDLFLYIRKLLNDETN